MLDQSLRVFAVDPDVFHVELVGEYLRRWGCERLDLFGDLDNAFQSWHLAPQVLVLRAHHGQDETIQMIQQIKQRSAETYVICLLEAAQVNWMPVLSQAGAFDFVVLGLGESVSFERVFRKVQDVQQLLERYYSNIK